MASSLSSACTRPRSASSSCAAVGPLSFSSASRRANSRDARRRSNNSRRLSAAMWLRSGRRSSSLKSLLPARAVDFAFKRRDRLGQARLSLARGGADFGRLSQFQFGHARQQARQLELALKGSSVGTGSTAFELLLAQAKGFSCLAACLRCRFEFAVERFECQCQRGLLRHQAVALVAQGVDLGHWIGRLAAQGDGDRWLNGSGWHRVGRLRPLHAGCQQGKQTRRCTQALGPGRCIGSGQQSLVLGTRFDQALDPVRLARRLSSWLSTRVRHWTARRPAAGPAGPALTQGLPATAPRLLTPTPPRAPPGRGLGKVGFHCTRLDRSPSQTCASVNAHRTRPGTPGPKRAVLRRECDGPTVMPSQ